MNKKFALLTFFSAIAAHSNADLRVVTTTQDLASIATMIGGSAVKVSSIVTGARDAHRIEAKPSFISKVANADVFIAVGYDLEAAYEEPILEGAANKKVRKGAPGYIAAQEFTYTLEKPMGNISRAHGDIHAMGNPHVMLDPYNGRLVATGIASRFKLIDKSNAAKYQAGLIAFLERLDNAMFGTKLVDKYGGTKLWSMSNEGGLVSRLKAAGDDDMLGGWSKRMLSLAGESVVSYHKSLPYLSRRFGFKVVGQLEPKPGLEPSPGHLAKIIDLCNSSGVKLLLQEPFYATKAANLVASKTRAKAVVIPQSVGQATGANDYVSLFDVIVNKLVGS